MLASKKVEFHYSPFSSKYILSSDKIILKAIVAFLYLKRSVMILTFHMMATEAMVLHIDHFQRMATVIVDFQKKVQKKEENKEINNNSESLLCDVLFCLMQIKS